MTSIRSSVVMAVLCGGLVAFAGPKGAPPPPGAGGDRDRGGPSEEMREGFAKKAHMMAVVGISDALGLNEADALKMSEKLKGFEEKRRPVREAMHTAMRAIKDAAEGDTAAQAQVDANVQKVLDGRAQLAALDKEMFTALAQGQTPEKRAKLALFMAKFGQEMHGFRGGKGRHHGGRE